MIRGNVHNAKFLKPLRIGFTAYALLFPLLLLSIYHFGWATASLAVAVVASSYWLIIAKRAFYPIIFLIVASRCINGFVVPFNTEVYKAMNFLTGYAPLILYISLYFMKYGSITKEACKRLFFTFSYLVLLIIYMLPNLSLSSEMFFPRVMPMLMLCPAIMIAADRIEWACVLRFFRIISVGALICYFLPGYLDASYSLLRSGVVFSAPVVDGQSIEMYGLSRMMGMFWDFRIQGLFSAAYLLIALVIGRGKLKSIDVLFALLTLMVTVSRGAIILAVIIMIGASLYYSRSKVHSFAKMLSLVGVLFACYFVFANDAVHTVLSTFDIFGDGLNAVSQRAGFREYALATFLSNPVGYGVGFISAKGIQRGILVGGYFYNQVSDAFLFIQLAEIGLIGFSLFLASLRELTRGRGLLGLSVLFGLIIVMVGTDLPNMGVFYFASMFMFYSILNYKVPYHENGVSAIAADP